MKNQTIACFQHLLCLCPLFTLLMAILPTPPCLKALWLLNTLLIHQPFTAVCLVLSQEHIGNFKSFVLFCFLSETAAAFCCRKTCLMKSSRVKPKQRAARSWNAPPFTICTSFNLYWPFINVIHFCSFQLHAMAFVSRGCSLHNQRVEHCLWGGDDLKMRRSWKLWKMVF